MTPRTVPSTTSLYLAMLVAAAMLAGAGGAAAQTGGAAGDTTAPVTHASVDPRSICYCDITVTLRATDADGSGVEGITYQATGAQDIASTTVASDTARITISVVGRTTVTFFATDRAGNSEDPPQSKTVIIDKTAPRVKGFAPQNLATGVSPNATVQAVFSERMKPLSITLPRAPSVNLFRKGSSVAVPAEVTYDAQTKTATLDPDWPLRAGVTYKAVVGFYYPGDGSSGYMHARDLAGNHMDQNRNVEDYWQPKVWCFTVAD